MQMWKQLRRSLLTVSDSGKIAESSVQRKIKEPGSLPSLRSRYTMILALVSHGRPLGHTRLGLPPARVGMAVTRSVSQARHGYKKCITS